MDRLLDAIACAAAEARTLHSSIKGSSDDPRERAWYFPPAAVVHAEALRLCAAHGLAIIFTGIEFDAAGRVLTQYTIRHTDSRESMVVQWPGEPMPDAPTVTHGIAAAARYAARALPAVLFSIPARADVRADEVVVDGVIVKLTAEQLAARDSSAATWAPGPPQRTEPKGRVETIDPRRLGSGSQPVRYDHDPAELAVEADAAALAGETVDPFALDDALRRWGLEANVKEDRLTHALIEAHEGDVGVGHLPISGSPAARARGARLVAFLRKGGWWS